MWHRDILSSLLSMNTGGPWIIASIDQTRSNHGLMTNTNTSLLFTLLLLTEIGFDTFTGTIYPVALPQTQVRLVPENIDCPSLDYRTGGQSVPNLVTLPMLSTLSPGISSFRIKLLLKLREGGRSHETSPCCLSVPIVCCLAGVLCYKRSHPTCWADIHLGRIYYSKYFNDDSSHS